MRIVDAAQLLAEQLGVPLIDVVTTSRLNNDVDNEHGPTIYAGNEHGPTIYAGNDDDLDFITDVENKDGWPGEFRAVDGSDTLCAHRSRFLVEAVRADELAGGWGVPSGSGLVSMKPEAMTVYGGDILVLAPAYPGTV